MPSPQRSHTVLDLLDAWLDAHIDTWAPSTLMTHTSIRARVGLHIGDIEISELHPTQLNTMYRDLSRGRRPDTEGPVPALAPATVNRFHAVVSSALALAVRWEWLTTNPARGATPPSRAQHRARSLDSMAVLRIARGIPAHTRFGVLVRLATVTGARRGELCALRRIDFDLDRSVLRISRAISVGHGCSRIERTTKTNRPRSVSLDPVTCTALTAWLENQTRDAARAGRGRIPNPFLFSPLLAGDRPLAPNSVTALWHRWKRRIASDGTLDHVRFGDLRHHAVTHMLGAGVPVTTVAARVGHSTPATTLRVYGHALPVHDAGAADVLAMIFDGEPPRATGRDNVQMSEWDDNRDRPLDEAEREAIRRAVELDPSLLTADKWTRERWISYYQDRGFPRAEAEVAATMELAEHDGDVQA